MFLIFIGILALCVAVWAFMNLDGGHRIVTSMVAIMVCIGSVGIACAISPSSGSSNSSSEKKWSDLSEVEKQNAKNAYEIREWIDDND